MFRGNDCWYVRIESDVCVYIRLAVLLTECRDDMAIMASLLLLNGAAVSWRLLG